MKYRPRRLRNTSEIRHLVAETSLSIKDFIVPLFVEEGKNIKKEISSMPGYYRYSLDTLKQRVDDLWNKGFVSVLLFCKISDELKDNTGKSALNPNGLMQRAINTIKQSRPEMLVMTDIALDPYSSYGHDGIVHEGSIVNDSTIEILAQMSLSHASVGADFVAPSDMMDGRVGAIRETLDDSGFNQVGIMSYAVKYASAFYGPFRDALDSTPGFGDKKTYQMDYCNRLEAIREAKIDEKEGADILMIKPAMAYLDIIREVRNQTNLPIAAYQVSGTYAMIKMASEQKILDYNKVVIEQLIAIKRAGANMIVSYFVDDIVKLI